MRLPLLWVLVGASMLTRYGATRLAPASARRSAREEKYRAARRSDVGDAAIARELRVLMSDEWVASYALGEFDDPVELADLVGGEA